MSRQTLMIVTVFGATLIASGCGTPRSDAVLRAYPYLAVGDGQTVSLDDLARTGDESGGRTDGAAPRLAGLDDVLALAVASSPAVRKAEADAHAAAARAGYAWAPPNPMFQAAWLPLPVETRAGPNVARFGISQTLPMPTELYARSQRAEAEQHLAEIRWEMAVRDSATGAKQDYAELWYLDRALDALSTSAELAQLLARRAAAADATAFTWLRAESQRLQLEFDQNTLTERRAAALAALNAQLSRPADGPIDTSADLPEQALPPQAHALWELAAQWRPEWRAAEALVRAAEAGVDIAVHRWIPELQLGAQLMVQTAPDGAAATMAGSAAGDEALAVTVGIMLPIWFGANAAHVDEADAQLEAALWARKAEMDALMAQVVAARFAWTDADRLVRLYDELAADAAAVLPRADARATGGGLGPLAEARATATSMQLASLRSRADRFRAAAALESVVGAPLWSTRPALPPKLPAPPDESTDESTPGAPP